MYIHIITYFIYFIVLQTIEENPEIREAVMKQLSVSPSISPSLTKQPSDRAMNMTTAELCQWLKDKKISKEYIKYFEEEEIDGSELAAYNDEDLKDMGISEPRVRIKILTQFRKI